MRLKEYFESLPLNERKTFISDLSVELSKSKACVRSYINGHRNVQAGDVHGIERVTERKVTKEELLPNIFKLIVDTYFAYYLYIYIQKTAFCNFEMFHF